MYRGVQEALDLNVNWFAYLSVLQEGVKGSYLARFQGLVSALKEACLLMLILSLYNVNGCCQQTSMGGSRGRTLRRPHNIMNHVTWHSRVKGTV